MVNIQNPLTDAVYDEQTGAYISILERQVIGQTVLLNQYRAVLEMITGEKHEAAIPDLETGQLKEIAVRAIMKRDGLTLGQARRKIREQEAEQAGTPIPAAE